MKQFLPLPEQIFTIPLPENKIWIPLPKSLTSHMCGGESWGCCSRMVIYYFKPLFLGGNATKLEALPRKKTFLKRRICKPFSERTIPSHETGAGPTKQSTRRFHTYGIFVLSEHCIELCRLRKLHSRSFRRTFPSEQSIRTVAVNTPAQ